MEYRALSKKERDIMLVNTLLSQERDHFMHTVNAERFQNMLASGLDPESEFAKRLQALLLDTISRKMEVELIIDNLLPQLPNETEVETALVFINAKEATKP